MDDLTVNRTGSDEFALLSENAAEAGLTWTGRPKVSRHTVAGSSGHQLSALVWGDGDPDLVLVHGGAQNAHTWDSVALALDRPLVAIDLPGHGHSDWRPDGDYAPGRNAEALAAAIEQLAPTARVVVGMSLGGLSTIRLAAARPDLVARLALIDVTPGVTGVKAQAIAAFVNGPESFASFEEILERTVAHNPTRSVASLRRGILHNAREREDGRWVWRYHRFAPPSDGDGRPRSGDYGSLWDDVSAITAPLLLVRGSLSPVVDDADVAELRRRQPAALVEVVDGAGHSVQGDRPVELAALLSSFTTA